MILSRNTFSVNRCLLRLQSYPSDFVGSALEFSPIGSDAGSANVLEPQPVPIDFPENNLAGGAQCLYSRKIRRITLERYLVSRIVHQVEEVSFADILILYDNLLWLQEKAEKDPGFQQKFGKDLSVVTEILKGTRFSPDSFPTTVRKLSVKFRTSLENFYYPMRNINGVERHLKGLYSVKPHKETGTPREKLKEPRRIGVGYKDKGHRRNEAIDGSPRWQDVTTWREEHES